jgi:5-methylcytosine-specific restriction endonuclease McrA
MVEDEDFLTQRCCMREPIHEIFDAAQRLNLATDSHLAGDHSTADSLIRSANIAAVRAWTESLLGSKAANPDQQMYHRFREVPSAPPYLPKAQRSSGRMPSSAEQSIIIERYGRNCIFCGIPLINKQVRILLNSVYPDALPWGRTNQSQHAAFQCMRMQFDHVIPHSRGGDNSLENIVITCAPCNFGRMQWTLDEVGLIDPRERPTQQSSWDGLERVLA